MAEARWDVLTVSKTHTGLDSNRGGAGAIYEQELQDRT